MSREPYPCTPGEFWETETPNADRDGSARPIDCVTGKPATVYTPPEDVVQEAHKASPAQVEAALGEFTNMHLNVIRTMKRIFGAEVGDSVDVLLEQAADQFAQAVADAVAAADERLSRGRRVINPKRLAELEAAEAQLDGAEAKVAAGLALADEWGYPVKYAGPADLDWAINWNQGCNTARAWAASQLRAALSGPSEPTCGADITHRDDEHRQSVCILPASHTSAHDDGQGCRWTDAEHHEPDEPTGVLDPVLAYLDRLRAMGPSAEMLARIDEVEQQHRAEQSWTAEDPS